MPLLSSDELTTLLPTLSTATLRSAWVETDATVQAVMWPPLLTFLKRISLQFATMFPKSNSVADFPQSWVLDQVDGDEGSDSEDESSKAVRKPPEAYHDFLQFLELGCSGSPVQGYPTVVIVLSTIPPSVWLDFHESNTFYDIDPCNRSFCPRQRNLYLSCSRPSGPLLIAKR